MSIYKRERGLVSGRKAGRFSMQFFSRAYIQYITFPSFIVGGFLKPHLHSWPLVSPLLLCVHLCTSKQLLRVHTVLERHLVDTFKALHLTISSLFCCCFLGVILWFCSSVHVQIFCGTLVLVFPLFFSSFYSSYFLTEVNSESVTKTDVLLGVIFCTDKSLWLTFPAHYDELHTFIMPRHSSVGLDPFIEMWTADSNSLESIRSLGCLQFSLCFNTNEITPLLCILFQCYRNASSRLPLSRLENSLLCKMEISVPLSIPLMTRPPLCYCRARLCLLFADVLSDCCVWLLR